MKKRTNGKKDKRKKGHTYKGQKEKRKKVKSCLLKNKNKKSFKKNQKLKSEK